MNDNHYCVYVHISKLNGKCYVGMTGQKPKKRWNEGKNYSNQYFGRVIAEDGWDNFDHIVLEKNLSLETALEKEREYVKIYNSQYPNGFNCTEGGDFNGNMIRVCVAQYSLDGEFIQTFDSYMDASRYIGGSEACIRGCADGEQKSAYGYMWKRYDGTSDNIEPYQKFGNMVIQYTLDGEFVKVWKTAYRAGEDLNLSRNQICEACRGNTRKTCGGYQWRLYTKDYPLNIGTCLTKVNMYDTNGKYIKTWNSQSEALKWLGGKNVSIANCLSGKSMTAGGYVWRYDDNNRHDIKVTIKTIAKRVNQYDLDGKFIRTWEHAKMAGENLGFDGTSITSCCKLKYTHTHGYQFRYDTGDYSDIAPLNKKIIERK